MSFFKALMQLSFMKSRQENRIERKSLINYAEIRRILETMGIRSTHGQENI